MRFSLICLLSSCARPDTALSLFTLCRRLKILILEGDERPTNVFFYVSLKTEILNVVVCLTYYIRYHLLVFLVSVFVISFHNNFFCPLFQQTLFSDFCGYKLKVRPLGQLHLCYSANTKLWTNGLNMTWTNISPSSPRPWIVVFVLHVKINVLQHDGDWEHSRPQGLKNVHNLLMTVQKMSWSWDLIAEMLLILKKIIFDLIIRGKVLDMTVHGVNLWLKLV